MKKIYLVSFIILQSYFIAFAQWSNLYIQHPQKLTSGQGTIKEASLVIEPFATYTKNDLYLTFSADGISAFQPDDSVEVQMNFSLGTGSFITDLWLWIGVDTSVALLADRAKARATYDNIVKRRRDPALLEMLYKDQYKLGVYPMRADGVRRIKITYFLPFVNNYDNSLLLPIWFLKASRVPLPKFPVYVKYDSLMNPFIKEDTSIVFSIIVDTNYGKVYKTEIPSNKIQTASTLTLVLNNQKANDALIVSKYQKGAEGVYHLSVKPSKALNLNTNKKILFVIDFDSVRMYYNQYYNTESKYSKLQLLKDLKNTIQSNLTQSDSFNVTFIKETLPFLYSQKWSVPTSKVIDSLINKLTEEVYSMDSINLSSLLFSAADFINKNGKDGQIFLITSSEAYSGNVSLSNKFIDSLTKILPPTTQINIIDYNRRVQYYRVGNSNFAGNGYLYTTLAAMTKGLYRFSYNPFYNQSYIDEIFINFRGSLDFFDMNVSIANGFTYMKQANITNVLNYPLTTTIMQAGRFNGSFPMSVEVTGKYGGQLYYNKVLVADSNIKYQDSSLYSIWASYIINTFPQYSLTDIQKQQMSEFSTTYRVLCQYTAFLALEPGQKLCDTCVSTNPGTVINLINKETTVPKSYEVLQAYPNPFNPSTILKIRLPEQTDAVSSTLSIYNTLGQLVKRFDTSKLSDKEFINLTWNAKDENGKSVATGMYIVILQTQIGKYSLKLMFIK